MEEFLLLRIGGKHRTQQCLQFPRVAIRRDSIEQPLQAQMMLHADMESLPLQVIQKGLEQQQGAGFAVLGTHPAFDASDR